MSSVGFVLLVHDDLHRAEQVARHWAAQGCPVVIHLDGRVRPNKTNRFTDALRGVPLISFSQRFRCEWGTWSLVAATQSAARQLLDSHTDVQHVFLASGSCLPLRPVRELRGYLQERSDTDFIESVTTEDVNWTTGGLDAERFTLRFPFSWKSQRYLFDRYVRLQRALGVKRKIPAGLVPHLGSQWWCLTRQTLLAILDSPARAEHERYFRRVWIPDESYFQSLVRLYSRKIESRSLTLSKFDFQGKPHIFYDDHLQLLRRSDCFVARKIWPKADRLYRAFLTEGGDIMHGAEPRPGKIDRVFSKSVERRTRGRPGLYMQSRFPRSGWENGVTAAPYTVLEGFTELFHDFEAWLNRTAGVRVHGHLFAPERAEFADGQSTFSGALPDSALLRDYNPRAFLTNLIWNTRGEHQCFAFGPNDVQTITPFLVNDSNALIAVISGAWAVPLFRSNQPFAEVRKEAARLQRIEAEHLKVLRAGTAKARVRIWSLADFVENPAEPLQLLIDELGPRQRPRLAEPPKLVDLTGFSQFLQELRNQGMQPHLMGDYPMGEAAPREAKPQPRQYRIR